MATANAFAQFQSALPNPPSTTPLPIMDTIMPSATSIKRVKLSPQVEQEIFSRKVDPETALEVDHMILDYLAYSCIRACLQSRQSSDRKSFHQQESLLHHIQLFDALLVIFKARHQSYHPDEELRFRIKLLRLVVLFTQRFSRHIATPTRQTLHVLRKRDSARARDWIGTADRIPTAAWTTSLFDSDLPISSAKLEQNRAQVLREVGQPAEDENYEDIFYGTSECVPLLNILPLFMEVSAAIIAITNSEPNNRWMLLAAQFMLQACLEQYTVFGASGTDAVDEAFAWGFDPALATSERPNAMTRVNEMFEHRGASEESRSWQDVKQFYLTQLSRDETTELSITLGKVKQEHPITKFEVDMLNFLSKLSESTSLPILAQLENGKLDDLSTAENREFLSRCGRLAGKAFAAA